MAHIVLEDIDGKNKAYKEFRRLYSVNQFIKKFVGFNRQTTNVFYFINGVGFCVADNGSPMHAEITILDAPVLMKLPYFALDTNAFFNWEKTNKKCNSIVWENGSLRLTAMNFETGECNDPYTTFVNQTQIVKHHASRQKTLEIFTKNPNTVYEITNDPRYKGGINSVIYCENLLDIMEIAGLFPSTKIGFSTNPEEPLVVMNQMSSEEFDNRLATDIVTFIHLPKKWLIKFEKGDILTITIKQVTDERYITCLNSINKRYGKRQFIESNSIK